MFICLPSRCPYMQGTQPVVYLTHPRVYTAGYELGEKLTVKQFNRSVFARLRITQRTEAPTLVRRRPRGPLCLSSSALQLSSRMPHGGLEGMCSTTGGGQFNKHFEQNEYNNLYLFRTICLLIFCVRLET